MTEQTSSTEPSLGSPQRSAVDLSLPLKACMYVCVLFQDLSKYQYILRTNPAAL